MLEGGGGGGRGEGGDCFVGVVGRLIAWYDDCGVSMTYIGEYHTALDSIGASQMDQPGIRTYFSLVHERLDNRTPLK